MTTLSTYPLRLPKTLKAEAEALSRADGTSLNQFVATAVAEKVAVLKTAAFFEERGARARTAAADGKPSALLAALSRTAGEPAPASRAVTAVDARDEQKWLDAQARQHRAGERRDQPGNAHYRPL